MDLNMFKLLSYSCPTAIRPPATQYYASVDIQSVQLSYKTASSTPMKSHDEAKIGQTNLRCVHITQAAAVGGCVLWLCSNSVEDKVRTGARKTWSIILLYEY